MCAKYGLALGSILFSDGEGLRRFARDSAWPSGRRSAISGHELVALRLDTHLPSWLHKKSMEELDRYEAGKSGFDWGREDICFVKLQDSVGLCFATSFQIHPPQRRQDANTYLVFKQLQMYRCLGKLTE